MLLISPRSHCVSNGAVSGKQGTKSEAAVTARGRKRQFWFPCELWDIDWCGSLRVTRPTHPETLDPGIRPGQRDNGPALATLPWQLSTRLHLSPKLPQHDGIWVWVWPRNFRTVFSGIVRIKKVHTWNLLLSEFNINSSSPFGKLKYRVFSVLTTRKLHEMWKRFQEILLCSDNQVLLNSRLFFRVIKPHFKFWMDPIIRQKLIEETRRFHSG